MATAWGREPLCMLLCVRAAVCACVPLCVPRQRARERWGREGWGRKQSEAERAWDLILMNWVEWESEGCEAEWGVSDERVIRLGLGLVFRDQNDIVLGEKSTNLKPGINWFNLRFFRFSGWTGRFFLLTVFLVIFGFL